MCMTTQTNRLPGVGDIWLVDYPYTTPGNVSKLRPGIVIDFDDDTVVVQKLTTRRKRGNKEFIHPKLKKKTYLSPEKVRIPDYRLIRYLGRIK